MSNAISLPQYTGAVAVTVGVTATGADQIQLSNDGSTFGAWTAIPASKTVSHTLTSGDGQKTVSARFRLSSSPAVVSEVVTANTTLDTVAPTGSLAINGGAPVTTSVLVTLAIAATDVSPLQMRLQNEGGAWGPWEPLASPRAWSLSGGNGAKTVKMELRDAAGNTSGTYTATIQLQTTNAGKWLLFKTPDYDDAASGVQTSYFRVGAANSAEEKALLDTGDLPYKDAARSGDDTFAGWFEYTDGSRTEVTRAARVSITQGSDSDYVYGARNVTVHGDLTTTIDGMKTDNIGGPYQVNVGTNSSSGGSGGTLIVSNSDPIFSLTFKQSSSTFAAGQKAWRQTTLAHVSSDSYTFGDTETFFGGYTFAGTFGLASSVYVGGKIDLSASVAVAASAGYNISFGASVNFSDVHGQDMRSATNHDLKARQSVRIRVKGDPSLTDRIKVRNALLALGAGTVVGISVGAFGAAFAPLDKDDQGNSTGKSSGAGAALGVAAAAFATGVIASVLLALKERAAAVTPSPTEIKLTDQVITLTKSEGAQPQSRIGVGFDETIPAAGCVLLENNVNAWLQLQGDGSVVANGDAGIYLQTEDNNAYLKLLKGGTARMKMQSWVVNSQQVNINNVLQIV